jgi:hypothetical protein
MNEEFLGWGGVRTLAKKLGYSWFDVCDILWKTKHHKQPEFKDYSRLVYWCNPFEPINKGKLGTSQGWRKEESFKKYY